MGSLNVEVAQRAGTCYGVQRAIDLAIQAGRASHGVEPVHTLGPLIHNPLVVKELEDERVLMANDLASVSQGTLIIRAHGVVPELIDRAREKGLDIVDATCPFVKKVHLAAERLVRDGYRVVVIGEPGHPEVEGILGHAGTDALVVENAEQARRADISGKVGVVVQTTQTVDNLSHVVAVLSSRCKELHVVNTICNATSERQKAAAELSARVDAMVIIGGKNSGNTRRLAEICREHCSRTFHVERDDELKAVWFKDASTVGVTAGASTPQRHIDQVIAWLQDVDI